MVAPRLDDPSVLEPAAIARILGADPERGLTTEAAARRLAEDGPNALRQAPPVPAWRKVLAQFRDPLIYLLLAAIGISLVAWSIEGRVGWPVDAIVIALIVVMNAVLGYVQEAKAENAVAALTRMTAVTSAVVREGVVARIPSDELVRGDVLLLGEGDSVGADARLVQAAALRVQEASLTGESEAVLKDATTLPGPVALADRTNMVFKGTAVAQGTGRAVVTATGMSTEMGSIAEMLEATKEEATPLQKEVGRIGRMLGVAVIVIAVVVVATVFAISEIRSAADVITVLLLGVSLAVAAVPEGLPAILSVILAVGVQRMAKRNAVVKKLSSVETLGSASVICSDKTGTLTRSEMTIQRVVTASGVTRVTGVGYAPQGRVEGEGGGPGQEQLRVGTDRDIEWRQPCQQCAVATNRAGQVGDPGRSNRSGIPRGGAQARRRRAPLSALRSHTRTPFTSERKMMSMIAVDHERNDEHMLVAKGAPDVLLARCTHVRIGLDVLDLDEAQRNRILADIEALSDEALRTLAVAYRPLRADEVNAEDEWLERELIFVGTVGIIDPPREEAAVAIREAHRAGIRVIMITGDHPRTAARIARDLGIIGAGETALTGLELDVLDDAAFADVVRRTSVYARVAPAHKMRIVDALQADGHIVAMTGDGVNDAPGAQIGGHRHRDGHHGHGSDQTSREDDPRR